MDQELEYSVAHTNEDSFKKKKTQTNLGWSNPCKKFLLSKNVFAGWKIHFLTFSEITYQSQLQNFCPFGLVDAPFAILWQGRRLLEPIKKSKNLIENFLNTKKEEKNLFLDIIYHDLIVYCHFVLDMVSLHPVKITKIIFTSQNIPSFVTDLSNSENILKFRKHYQCFGKSIILRTFKMHGLFPFFPTNSFAILC